MEIPRSLDERQMQILADLVRIESPSGSEQQILQYIEERLQQHPDLSGRIKRQPVDKTHWNLLVEKGAHEGFTVLLYAHVDTVRRCDGWENDYRLVPDGRHPGILRGVGCLDMKSGAMIVVDLLERLRLPMNVRLIAAFCGDEEKTSKGAEKLLEWEGWEDVDLILSPETATRTEERDDPKDIVIGRRGNVKTVFAIKTPGGHGYDAATPSAIAASRELRNHLMHEFRTMFRKEHSLFGAEQLDETFEHSPSAEFLDRPTDAAFGLRNLIVPPHSIADSVAWQNQCKKRLEETRQWIRQGIGCTLTTQSDATLYEPYLTDPHHELLRKIIAPAARGTFGNFEYVGGLSPADSNILAQKGLPVVEVGPVGGDAHRGTEWVSESSVACTNHFYCHLIQVCLPDYLRSTRS